ncbi:O-methyltransferase [Aspergillus undulatus]|uniref:O-methyltransferase n=1 Tax=Aspergillus undulatus TaxID=1810928 RepID=UPI003CCDA995
MSETYLKMAEEAFCRAGATDRIELLRGRCLDLLPTLKGDFDLIYIDAAEEEYKAYTSFILDNKLLSPDGVILVDDVLLEGLVLDRSIAQGFPSEIQEPYLAIADMINDFNAYLASDPRIEVTVLPLFNGITQIMWK